MKEEKKFVKTVIINRAVPGSGKTTLSKNIFSVLSEHGLHVSVHSTDDYFMVGTTYCFDVRKLSCYHKRNQEAFYKSLQAGTDVVVCDNTNLIPWETEPYTGSAREYGYRVLFINFQPRELEKHVQAQLVTPEKPDAHGVPKERLIQFIHEYNRYDVLLQSTGVVDPTIHFDYRWDEKRYRPIRSGIGRRFDYDDVIQVSPENYHTLKHTIGNMVLNVIRIG